MTLRVDREDRGSGSLVLLLAIANIDSFLESAPQKGATMCRGRTLPSK